MRAPPALLAIATDTPWLATTIEWFRKRGTIVHVAASVADGIELHKQRHADTILVGLPLVGGTITMVLGALLAADPLASIVVAGVDAEIATRTHALSLGASAYVADPDDRHDLVFAIGEALGMRKGAAPLRPSRLDEAVRTDWRSIVGASAAMRNVLEKLRLICDRTLSGAAPTVLLSGEIGTGKSLLARSLHYNSARRRNNLIEVSCWAPDIEGLLFGGPALPGAFELADGGTLILNEIAAIPPALQPRLLAAIDDRVVGREGNVSRRVDMQIVASTRRDLAVMTRTGELRPDLYHRLSVVTVEVPPLRERGDDIVAISERIIAELAAEHGLSPPRLSDDAREALARHEWPGNLRELAGELERIVLLVDADVIEARHVYVRERRTAVAIAHDEGKLELSILGEHAPLEEIERELIRQALEKSNGNVSRAARFLSITRQTMLYRMKKHGFASPSTPDLDKETP